MLKYAGDLVADGGSVLLTFSPANGEIVACCFAVVKVHVINVTHPPARHRGEWVRQWLATVGRTKHSIDADSECGQLARRQDVAAYFKYYIAFIMKIVHKVH